MSSPSVDEQLRHELVELGRSLFERGLTAGRTGNLSVRVGDRFLVTPTGSSLGQLTPDGLATAAVADGAPLPGPRPSKEAFLHAAFYRARPAAMAVAHLHSTYAVAVSCLEDVDARDVLPPLTAYYAMRVGRLPLLPYHAPGDRSLTGPAEEAARRHHAVLLANHGPIVAAASLAEAVDAVEEVEETARLFLLLGDRKTRPLTPEQVAALAPMD